MSSKEYSMKRGRPKGGSAKKALTTHEKKSAQLGRVSQAEFDDIAREAQARGLSVQEMVVEGLREAGIVRSKEEHTIEALELERARIDSLIAAARDRNAS